MKFYANKSKMKPIYKSIRKNYKRWRYGKYVAVFFIVLGVALSTYFFFTMGRYELDGTLEGWGACIITTLAVFLFPFIAFMISLAVAKSTGRDIILARENETIEISEDKIIISYFPKFKEVVNANYVEDEIFFSDIKSVEYESNFLRTKVIANYTHNEYMSRDKSNKTKSNYCSNANILVYDYYDRMDELKEVLLSKRNEVMV